MERNDRELDSASEVMTDLPETAEDPDSVYLPPAIISDGRGQSLRFHWRNKPTGQTRPGVRKNESGGSQKLYELDITIANPDMIRDLFRTGRKEDAGRLPDLLFLELRFQNRSRESINYDPFQVRINCESTDLVSLPEPEAKIKAGSRTPQGATSGEKRTLAPLNPQEYEIQYSGISHSWLSYAWHMSPRPAAHLYRQDPSSPVPRNLHRFSQKDQEEVRNRNIAFLSSLRKPFRVEPHSTMILYLPFLRLEPGERCRIQAPMPGSVPVESEPFHYLRVDSEALERLQQENRLENLRSGYRSPTTEERESSQKDLPEPSAGESKEQPFGEDPGPAKEDSPELAENDQAPALLGKQQRRIFILERQRFHRRLEKEEAELKELHMERRKAFCQSLPSDGERESFSFCTEGIFWHWFGAGFD